MKDDTLFHWYPGGHSIFAAAMGNAFAIDHNVHCNRRRPAWIFALVVDGLDLHPAGVVNDLAGLDIGRKNALHVIESDHGSAIRTI